jgi:hypothetical protein
MLQAYPAIIFSLEHALSAAHAQTSRIFTLADAIGVALAAARLIVTSPRPPGESQVVCHRLTCENVFFISYFFATSFTR